MQGWRNERAEVGIARCRVHEHLSPDIIFSTWRHASRACAPLILSPAGNSSGRASEQRDAEREGSGDVTRGRGGESRDASPRKSRSRSRSRGDDRGSKRDQDARDREPDDVNKKVAACDNSLPVCRAACFCQAPARPHPRHRLRSPPLRSLQPSANTLSSHHRVRVHNLLQRRPPRTCPRRLVCRCCMLLHSERCRGSCGLLSTSHYQG